MILIIKMSDSSCQENARVTHTGKLATAKLSVTIHTSAHPHRKSLSSGDLQEERQL